MRLVKIGAGGGFVDGDGVVVGPGDGDAGVVGSVLCSTRCGR